MVAILLGTCASGDRGQLGAAHQYVWSRRSRIEIDELAAIEISEVFAVRRPGQRVGQISCERAVREYLLDREGNAIGLGGNARGRKENGRGGRKNAAGCASHKNLRWRNPSPASAANPGSQQPMIGEVPRHAIRPGSA